ncbi:hypothetical protein HO173_009644 [Letharia columbiana]|uniref:Myb-like DNA-binding domain-containing protein n=1 Tax=Letharia columbiana TaxID=112416 RepID=A0A8H6FPJ6_9LECA|nr:uncharacterized protein HO173_009644 [Letharia columbiana]KAF6232261.1 hypothetical protein HO173_009644 [Letharia columbiana]
MASKHGRFVISHRDPSKFKYSLAHKYLDAPGDIENCCRCTCCVEYQPKYRVKRSPYQDQYPFGLPDEDPEDQEPEPDSDSDPDPDPDPDQDQFKGQDPHQDRDKDPNQDPDQNTDEHRDVPTTKDIPLSSVVVRFIRFIEMAPASNEEQFKFLISCIRYSNNGKVDFTEVAKECNIVSKGAAAKRYERMMKANGIHQSQSGGTTASGIRDTPIPSPRRKTSPSAGSCSKKRKLDQYAETNSNFNTDDDEGLGNVKAESSITVKAESIKAEPIKEEPMGQEGTPESTAPTGAFQYPSSGGTGFDGAHDSAMFDDFLAFGGSSSHDHGSQAAFHGGFADQRFASMSMTPATGNGDGQGLHESIVITD